ncbi:MAG: threonine synthase [Chloroflexi bacterium]|nr:threonine synthase [Chloroflexota bacterium]
MTYVKALRCRECGREYPQGPTHVCEFCFGPLEVAYDYQAIQRDISREAIAAGPGSIWRYQALLPVQRASQADLGAGWTPLIKANNLARALGLRELYLKNDCVNPTYSFKDRVVAVATAKALEFGFDTLACASTGNLAAAVSAQAAKAGLRAYVFIPADLEQGKIVGAAVYGATLVSVQGNYDQANRLASEVADRYGWAFVNINLRPYYAEGSKTLAFEVAEQLGWRVPDHVVVPIASGSLFTKIWKGWNELAEVGLLDGQRPRMTGAQAAGCSPVAAAFATGSWDIRPVKPWSIAKSLAIGNPADGHYALKVARESGGYIEMVQEQEIAQGVALLARTEGLFAETAAGVTVAALQQLATRGKIGCDEVTVAYITGNGLKTQEAIAEALAPALVVSPTLTSFEQALARQIPPSDRSREAGAKTHTRRESFQK